MGWLCSCQGRKSGFRFSLRRSSAVSLAAVLLRFGEVLGDTEKLSVCRTVFGSLVLSREWGNGSL